MIKTIAFDLGGVIITLDSDEPVRRFEEIGLTDAGQLLNPYAQTAFFGDLERGRITDEEFLWELSERVGHEVTWQQCQHAWLGYVVEVPVERLHFVSALREQGYRVVLASNTNIFMQTWARSKEFSADGQPIDSYFDRMYCSYEMRAMKPDDSFFRHILSRERVLPADLLFVDDSARNCAAASELGIHTLCTENGEDWREKVKAVLEATRQ
jgi:putative hydrolase of the HAD superfamily